MIRFYYLLFFCSTTFCVQAQLADYWGTAGGGVQASFRDDQINTFTDIQLNIEVGKIVGDKAIIGAGLQVGTAIIQSKDRSADRFSTSSTGLDLFAQYYFFEQNNWAIYARPSFEFAKIYNTAEAIGLGSSGDRIDYWRGAIGGGVNYFLQPNIALQAMADFSLVERLTADGVSFSDGLKPELRLGLQFFSSHYNPDKVQDKEQTKSTLKSESWTVGGDVNWRNRTIGGSRLAITPSIAYFSLNQLAIGFEFSGIYQFQDSTNRVEVTPFMRYYIPMRNQYFLIEGGVGLGASKVPILIDGERTFDILTDAIGELKGGLGIFMSENVALQGALRYQYILPITDDIDPLNAFFDVGLEVGLHYFFGGRTFE